METRAENMFSISFRKHLLTLIIKILFAQAIITSTAHASSVFLSIYRISTGIFLGLFSNANWCVSVSLTLHVCSWI